MCQRLRWSIGLMLCACAVGLLEWRTASKVQEARAAPMPTSAPGSVEQLRAELQEVLQQVVRARTIEAAKGKTDLRLAAALREAVLALKAAELEAAKTPAESIQIRESVVVIYAEEERACQGRYRAGWLSLADCLKAKADRIRAEIDLEKAKSLATASSKAG